MSGSVHTENNHVLNTNIMNTEISYFVIREHDTLILFLTGIKPIREGITEKSNTRSLDFQVKPECEA